MPTRVVDEIIRLFETEGEAAYHGEPVSQAEHALQCAALAEAEGAADDLIAAALLHDVGHLIHGLGEDAAERGVDGRHEDEGAAWLARHFGAAVVEPIRLHVDAKRYLCAVDDAYRGRLSPASRLSLTLQGGPMNRDEAARFEANPHHGPALRLRRWDDEAKVQGLNAPGLEHYRTRLEAALRRGPDR